MYLHLYSSFINFSMYLIKNLSVYKCNELDPLIVLSYLDIHLSCSYLLAYLPLFYLFIVCLFVSRTYLHLYRNTRPIFVYLSRAFTSLLNHLSFISLVLYLFHDFLSNLFIYSIFYIILDNLLPNVTAISTFNEQFEISVAQCKFVGWLPCSNIHQ